MSRRPEIKKGELTYVWVTNAPAKALEVEGNKVTRTDDAPDVYEDAILDRPRGAEDIPLEDLSMKRSGGNPVRFTTIASNQAAGLVGIYVLEKTA